MAKTAAKKGRIGTRRRGSAAAAGGGPGSAAGRVSTAPSGYGISAARSYPRLKTQVCPSLSLEMVSADFSRADLEFDGIDHSQASYEVRVFLNNAKAVETTPPEEGEGYAGTFYVFGHGGCYGDEGHCEVNGAPRPFDPRPAHPLSPLKKTLIATDAVKRALGAGNALTVTVVPIVSALTEKCSPDPAFQFSKVSLVTYD